MKALKFCFVTTFYPPYSAGGDGIAVQRLARELVRQGHEVTVIHDVDAFKTLGRAPLPPDRNSDDGVEVVQLRSGWGIASPLAVQQTGHPVFQGRKLSRLISNRFDVVNFHNASLVGGPGIFHLGGDAVRIYTAHEHWLVCPTHILWRDGKEVCTSRNCISCQLHYHRPPQLWRSSSLMRKSSQTIDAFIAMSEFSREKHREFGFEPDMHVIPPCSGQPNVSSGTSSPHHRPYFFFAGRLEPGKGLQTILPVLREFPDIDLLVAGDGSLKATVAREGGPQVIMLDQLPSDSLERYYVHAIATVVPSLVYETFGLTLAESFRCSTPVIARRIGPFPEIVSSAGGGILFSDDAELRDAMRKLAGDATLRSNLGARGRKAFLQWWQDSASAGSYLNLVKQTLMSKRAAAHAL